MPDFLLCTSNICHTVIKWYENLSKELNIPLIMFDTPFNHTDQVQDHNAKYMKGQLYHIIDQLEEITAGSSTMSGCVKSWRSPMRRVTGGKKPRSWQLPTPHHWMGLTSLTTWPSLFSPGDHPGEGICSISGTMNCRKKFAFTRDLGRIRRKNTGFCGMGLLAGPTCVTLTKP